MLLPEDAVGPKVQSYLFKYLESPCMCEYTYQKATLPSEGGDWWGLLKQEGELCGGRSCCDTLQEDMGSDLCSICEDGPIEHCCTVVMYVQLQHLSLTGILSCTTRTRTGERLVYTTWQPGLLCAERMNLASRKTQTDFAWLLDL